MNGTRAPLAGTKCVDCGCCEATIFAGNDPVCWECDAGEPCKGKLRRAQEQPRAKIVPAPVVETLTRIEDRAGLSAGKVLGKMPEPKPAVELKDLRSQFDRDEEEGDGTMSTKASGGRQGHRVSDEIRAKIQAEPVEMSHAAVARKYGITDVTARAIRLEKPKPAAKVTPIMQRVEASVPGPITGVKVTISAEMTEEGANAYWSSLTLEQKGAMIQLQLQEILKRATA